MSQNIVEPSSSLHSLVTEALVDTRRYYCPFLERGYCREPTRCNFSHDSNLSTKIPTDYCHFYLANQCLYGQECKFLHTEPEIGEPNEFLENPITATTATIESTHIIETVPGNSSNCDYDDDIDDNVYLETRGEDEHGRRACIDEVDASSSKRDGGPLEALRRLAKLSDESEGFMYNSNSNNTDSNQHNQTYSWHQTNAETSQQHDSTSATGPTSRLKARVSQRCAMVAPSLSSASPSSSSSLATASILAKLHMSQNFSSMTSATTATSAAHISTMSDNTNLKSTPSNVTAPIAPSSSAVGQCQTGTRGAWQNTRLIASIRNNLVESNYSSGSASASATGGCSSNTHTEAYPPLCPYSLTSGVCPFPEGHCGYLHGLFCDLCYSACLHPFNEKQRHQHREDCLREHEREMELSFAVQRSKDKVCGICMDTVVEKKPITSSRFGILEKCNHIFCLDCIRKWRGTKTFDSRTIRACPECRVSSDFVVPSKYWVEDQDDKNKLITDYKSALRTKPCRYFKEGKGECPFAGSCFYKHAYPDGSIAVLDKRPRRKLYGARGPTTSVPNYILWNILTSTDEDDLDPSMDDSLYDLYEMYNLE